MLQAYSPFSRVEFQIINTGATLISTLAALESAPMSPRRSFYDSLK